MAVVLNGFPPAIAPILGYPGLGGKLRVENHLATQPGVTGVESMDYYQGEGGSMRRSVFLLVLAGTVVFTSCGPEARSVAVTPTEVNMSSAGATIQIDAEPRDRLGARVNGAVLAYRSRAPEVASVSSTGLVRAEGHGTTTIVVQVEGTELMEFVHVTVRLPERVDIRPGATTCYIGGLKQLKARVLDHSGKAFQNVHFDWSSSDETKARVDNGEVVGIEEGEVEITATAMGLKATSKISVSWAPGQKAMLEAEERAGRGGGGKRGGRGQGQGEGGGGAWDPRLSMWDD